VEILAAGGLGVALALAVALLESGKGHRWLLELLVYGGLAAEAVGNLVERHHLGAEERERDADGVDEIQLARPPVERQVHSAEHWHLRRLAARRLRVVALEAVAALEAGGPRNLRLGLLADDGLAADASHDFAQHHRSLERRAVHVAGEARWGDAACQSGVVGREAEG